MKERLGRIGEIMAGILDNSPPFLHKDLEPLFLTPGKMLRPAFTLLAASAGDKTSPYLYDTATAIELVHMAALIHDDVLDKANERRGVRTINADLGAKRAVLTGDFLLFQALKLASKAHDNIMVNEMNKAASKLCLSEIDQDSNKGNFFISRETYYERISGKTAVLFALACKVGALLGGASVETSNILYQAGEDFGMAFQIEDDILDYTGTKAKMGKSPGKDLKEGIPTLPLILALEVKDPEISKLCRARFRPLFNGRIRKKVLSRNYDKISVDIAESFRKKCLTGFSETNLREKDTFSKIIMSLKSREL